LQQLSSRDHASHHRFRLAIDRAFTVKGAGLVVTGTALSGEVNVGDTLWLTGVNKPMRVRGCMRKTSPLSVPCRAAYRAEYCRGCGKRAA
jgi:selenocysteine-specific elongation factor